jgi:hypothetical protein
MPKGWVMPPIPEEMCSFLALQEHKSWSKELLRTTRAIQLAVYLKRPGVLAEILHEALQSVPTPFPILELVILGLVRLGESRLALLELDGLWQQPLDVQAFAKLHWILQVVKIVQNGCKVGYVPFLKELPYRVTGEHLYPVMALLYEAKRQKNSALIQSMKAELEKHALGAELESVLQAYF